MRPWLLIKNNHRAADQEAVEELDDEKEAAKAFDPQEPIMDRLFDLRDLVLEHGNKLALRIIFDTAKSKQGNPSDRLMAVDVLEELGYRAIPMELLPEILSHPEVDDYWAGELLLRFGDKARALNLFEKAIENCPEGYRDQIARELANLQASVRIR
ncbi:hypothetical protein [Mesorhizobium sp. M0239]|uniref:hypothetical protein n=1 Tax=Mesorhizobium sp. M0239 TaxID=2956924 RepID=UPI00333C2E06